MRYEAPMIQCDAEDGFCGAQTADYYEQTASGVDGVPITPTQRAPGWRSTDTEDHCPDHAALTVAVEAVGLAPGNPEPMEAP